MTHRLPRPGLQKDACPSEPRIEEPTAEKTSDRLSISATLTEAVGAMLRTGLEPLCKAKLRGTGSHAATTLRQDYGLAASPLSDAR